MERDESIEWWLKAWYAEPKEENEIEVGDEVEVTNDLCCHDTYAEWVQFYVSDLFDRLKYDFNHTASNGDIGIVKEKGPHYYTGKMLYYIELDTGRCYLISEDGIKLHRKKMRKNDKT